MPTAEERVLAQVWRSLRRKNPALPTAVEFVIVPTRQPSVCAGPPRIFIARSTLRDPAGTLQLLLHTAAHCLTPDGGLSTASKGSYHTKEYRATATQLGLETLKTGSGRTRSGNTVLTAAARDRYARELEMLQELAQDGALPEGT